MEESTSDNVKKKLVSLLFQLATIDIEKLNFLIKLIGDAHIKILIILDCLGGMSLDFGSSSLVWILVILISI